MFKTTAVPWLSWIEGKTSKREVVGSSPTVGKNVSFFFLAFFNCLTAYKGMKSIWKYVL